MKQYVRQLPKEKFLQDSINIAYLAGYFDGEGTICITKSLTSPQVSIKVCSADIEVIALFARTFYGSYSYAKPQKQTKRQQFVCILTGRKALFALWQMYPYLKAKQYPASFALLFEHGHAGTPLSQAELTVRKYASNEVTIFNHRVTV